ncbi:MAG: ABC transporter ATP-binding protein [Pseudomonadota bacterium]
MSVVLATHDLCKNYGAITATDNVSLELRAGECHALIGPNGAGKTTYVNQLSGLLRSDSGRIEFLGTDITNHSTAQRAQAGLGRTFQITSIIPSMTLFENVALAAQARCGSSFRFFGRASSDRAVISIAQNALERIGLTGRDDRLAANLSHGEKRALELAIAIAGAPKAMLLDEPMAGIGNDESDQLTDALLMLKRDYPLLLIEHDMDAVFKVADRISVLVYGRIIASGTPDEVRANPEARSAYLGEAA